MQYKQCLWICSAVRVSGHGGGMSRSFIVEDYAEDEYGQWPIDEVTSERRLH